MEQLIEMRANPVEFPAKEGENTKGYELIFIASRIGYTQDMRGNVMQVPETTVYRLMATPGPLAQTAAHLLALLPADIRKKVLEVDYEQATSEAAH